MYEHLKEVDPEIYQAVVDEAHREHAKLELIASENFVPYAILEAIGQPMQNKYAEGYPGRRYYGGCEFVDVAERLARKRAKRLFGSEHANVQPHSGAQANTAAYMAFLKAGDKIMGMDLSHGGHLTHGHPLNFSGIYFDVVSYGVDRETEQINYFALAEQVQKEKPKMLVVGASAYARKIDFARTREIADSVDAYLMVDIAHWAGLIAAGLYPTPIPHAHVTTSTVHKTLRGPRSGLILCPKDFKKQVDKAVFPGVQGGPMMHAIAAKAVCFKLAATEEFKIYQQQVLNNARALASALAKNGFRIVSGGTDCHLLLVDVKSKGLTGKEAEEKLDSVGITCNKNTIPFDTEKPFIASGIRLGTPALTTRGMGVDEMGEIADLIAAALMAGDDSRELSAVKGKVAELCDKFLLYEEIWKGEELTVNKIEEEAAKTVR
ncbi:serine hydroxymethyltransferase [bacterium]|nr:serine hydroxymethyltransferase [bacterium]